MTRMLVFAGCESTAALRTSCREREGQIKEFDSQLMRVIEHAQCGGSVCRGLGKMPVTPAILR